MTIDAETQRALDALTAELHERDVQLAEASRRIGVLEARLARWAENGLAVADEESIFAGYGGAFGTSTRVKRSDA